MTTSTGIGKHVRRKEDFRLLTGAGCYSDDVNLPSQAYAAMVRSPHAHARIGAIETGDARAMPGVLAVLTGRDALADGLVRPIPHTVGPTSPPDVVLVNRDGSSHYRALHLPIPVERARFVGEVVAIVIAESAHAARDAAERVRVEYEPLPSVTDTAAAAEPGAPRLREERQTNVCIDADVGDAGRNRH